MALLAQAEDHHGDGGDHQRQEALQRVEPHEGVVGAQRERRDQDHAEGAAEVAAVDGRGEHRGQEHGSAVGCARLRGADPALDLRRQREHDAGQQHQRGHHGVEHRAGQYQQQDAADDRARDADRARGQDPAALAAQLDAHAQHVAEVARPLGHGVGDVRRERGEAHRQQRGEHEQRPPARDRVHRPRDQPGDEQERQPARRRIDHPRTLSRRVSVLDTASLHFPRARGGRVLRSRSPPHG